MCLPPTVYLDDVSCILTAVSDAQLLRGIASLTSVVHQEYAGLALSLSYKRSKTCVLVHMAGKQKGSLKQMLVKVAHDHGLEGTWMKECANRMIQVAPSYESVVSGSRSADVSSKRLRSMLTGAQRKRLRHCYSKLVRRTAKLEVNATGDYLKPSS
eukprot:5385228-Amphidinium_carterae.1